jgi:geranylgeranyl reductase family protein
VLIAGAGPSGSICAYYLARSGKKVILIDTEDFPREKICGGFVSPTGINELMNIGIGDLPDFQKANVITCAAVHIDGKKLITGDIPDLDGLVNYGRVFPRRILDKLILDAAKSKGVRVVTRCKLEQYAVSEGGVRVSCKEGDEDKAFTVRLLIGADGSNSTVAKIMHGRRAIPHKKIIAVRAYFENVSDLPNQAELFFNSKSFPGYYWFFPMGHATANVGVGMSVEYFPPNGTTLKELLLDILENDPALKASIGNGKIAGKIEGWPLSIYDPDAPVVGDRVLLTGDAAGLVNSINGEGIQYALQSGRWAAESAIQCFSENNLSAGALTIFDRKVRKEIGYDMSLSNLVLQFIRNRNLNPLWMMVLKVFIDRAKIDERYKTIAGGILAGMVPTQNAVTPYFIWKSILQALATVFSGPFTAFTFVKKAVLFAVEVITGSVRQRAGYWNWIKGLCKGAMSSLSLLRY